MSVHLYVSMVRKERARGDVTSTATNTSSANGAAAQVSKHDDDDYYFSLFVCI
jgi:hypothetical protein